MRFRKIEKQIFEDGWMLDDVRGSHYQYKHPTKKEKLQFQITGETFRKELLTRF